MTRSCAEPRRTRTRISRGVKASTRYYQAVPGIVQQKMDELAAETGRAYHLFDYFGDPEAESVIISMGSGSSTVRETVDWLNANSEGRYGGIVVRLYPAILFRGHARMHCHEAQNESRCWTAPRNPARTANRCTRT